LRHFIHSIGFTRAFHKITLQPLNHKSNIWNNSNSQQAWQAFLELSWLECRAWKRPPEKFTGSAAGRKVKNSL
jgi:hypothetical protein